MFRWTKTKDLSAEKVYKNVPTYVVLTLALGAMTFFGVCDPGGPQSPLPGGNAATVGNYEVSSTTFRRYYRQIQSAEATINRLVNEYILLAECERSGLWISDDELAQIIVNDQNFQTPNGQFDLEQFTTFLDRNGYTEASFEEEQRRNLNNYKFSQFLNETFKLSDDDLRWRYQANETKYEVDYLKLTPQSVQVVVSDKDVADYLANADNKKKTEAYYSSHKSEFNSEKRVRARHILSSFQGARDATGDGAKRPKADAKARAEGILAEVAKNGGKDFAKIAKAKTDDPTGKGNGGDLGFFKSGELSPEVSQAAFAMTKGQIQLIESPFGFHVLMVEDIEPKKESTPEAAYQSIARKELHKTFAPKKLAERAEQLLTSIKNNKDITAELNDLKLSWATTSPFTPEVRFISGLGSSEGIKLAVFNLKKPGELHQSVIDSNGTKYILRLKSLTKPDLSKFDDSAKKLLASSSRFQDINAVYRSLRTSIIKDYNDSGKVRISPVFLELDKQRQNQDASGA